MTVKGGVSINAEAKAQPEDKKYDASTTKDDDSTIGISRNFSKSIDTFEAATNGDEAENNAGVQLTENEKKDLYKKLGRLKNRINSERWKHNLAHQHLSTLHFWLFTLPLAIISMASGILAFMSTIGYSQTVQNNLSIVVGCLSVFAVFLQTIARVCHYESKADMHFSASVDMRDLVDDIESIELERGTKYEIVEKVNIFKTIFGKYSQTMKGCKAIMIPNRIAQAFGIIDAKMVLYKDGCPNDPSSHYIWTLCHNQLYIEISNYTYWPFVIPPAEYVVKKVLNKIDKKKRDDEIEKLWGEEDLSPKKSVFIPTSNFCSLREHRVEGGVFCEHERNPLQNDEG